MEYKYTFITRTNHGKTIKHKRPFKTIDNAKAKLKELDKRTLRVGNAITGWAIQDLETGELVEIGGNF